MGSYRNDDEALIGLARQLTDAYGEARTREDQDYACESVAEFLSEFRDAAPSEALLAILDLPLTAETYPLVDEAQVALAARGPGVVELLLEAVLGDVYDPDGPAPERAAETLDLMDPGEASLGLCQVLCGRGDDQLKGAAVDGLVALGGLAEPDLVVTLDDRVGGEWARAALEQLRFEREHPGLLADEEAEPEDEEPAVDDEEPAADDDDASGESAADADVEDEPVDADDERSARPARAKRPSRPSRAATPPPDPPVRAPPGPTRRSSTTPTTTSCAGSSRNQAGSRPRPNVAQSFLNTGFIFTCESVHKPRTAETVAPPTVAGSG